MRHCLSQNTVSLLPAGPSAPLSAPQSVSTAPLAEEYSSLPTRQKGREKEKDKRLPRSGPYKRKGGRTGAYEHKLNVH